MMNTDLKHHEELILQSLDIESTCLGLYSKGRFYDHQDKSLTNRATVAWKHSECFEEAKYTYLSLYLRGESLSSYGSGLEKLKTLEQLIGSQKIAAQTAKVDLSDICFLDLLPDHLLNQWLSLRESVMQNILREVDRPKDYDILHKIHVLTTNLSKTPVRVGHSLEKIRYNMFSSATGRLATEKGFFPILNISKEERGRITPQNDVFLELDLNGAEIRTLLALSGKQQPNHDIHEYNKEVLTGGATRKETKARFFAWLYNPEATDKELEKLYNKDAYRGHYKEGYITTPYGRELKVDERRALNYLTQSTTSDIVLENAYKIMNFLKGKKSFVAFTMHDSVVLDFCKEEHNLVGEIKNIFETNIFGRFLSTVCIGKNYGNLREIKVD